MNDELFLKLRSMAQQAGCTAYNIIRRLGPYDYAQLFGNTERAAASKLYRDFKDAHFYRLYMSGAVKPVQAEHAAYTAARTKVMCIDIETTPDGECIAAMCLDSNNALHYVGCSKGSMSCAQPNLQNIPKEQPVNKTIADIQAELDAAVAAKAEKDIIDQRAAELARYFRLHAATGAVLTDIRDKAITPRALTAEFRSELKALAAEFGYRIVLVGDRSAAVLVQQ